MTSRFIPGATAYTKDGRSYIVDEVQDGTVYCRTTSGAETEFAEADLTSESEWAQRSDGRRDLFYTRLKQAPVYTTAAGKHDRAVSEKVLAKITGVSPSLLDFAAFTVASKVMVDNGDKALIPGLSINKCREIFDSARPEVRVSLVANLLGMQVGGLVDAGRLGDNLMRALIEKGLADNAEAFEEFCDRPRR
jgi:hypothetical protein